MQSLHGGPRSQGYQEVSSHACCHAEQVTRPTNFIRVKLAAVDRSDFVRGYGGWQEKWVFGREQAAYDRRKLLQGRTID